MLSLCLDGTWNGAGLIAGRIAAFSMSLYALGVLLRMLRGQPSKRKRLVPRSMIVFTMGWLVVTLITSFTLLVTTCTYVLSSEVRTLYGQGFAWSIGGLAFIASIGLRHHAKWDGQKLHEEEIHAALQKLVSEEADFQYGPDDHSEST